jgi:hypothetical protein
MSEKRRGNRACMSTYTSFRDMSVTLLTRGVEFAAFCPAHQSNNVRFGSKAAFVVLLASTGS